LHFLNEHHAVADRFGGIRILKESYSLDYTQDRLDHAGVPVHRLPAAAGDRHMTTKKHSHSRWRSHGLYVFRLLLLRWRNDTRSSSSRGVVGLGSAYFNPNRADRAAGLRRTLRLRAMVIPTRGVWDSMGPCSRR